MNIITDIQPDYVLVSVVGSLSNEELTIFKSAVDKLLSENDTNYILDLEHIAFICSSALSVIFMVMNEVKRKNHKFIICSLRDDIQKLFVITGVDKHIPLFNSVKEAVSSLK